MQSLWNLMQRVLVLSWINKQKWFNYQIVWWKLEEEISRYIQTFKPWYQYVYVAVAKLCLPIWIYGLLGKTDET